MRLLDYRNLDDSFSRRFDAVIANGPIEHFVQPEVAADGGADRVYQDMFHTLHQAIDPTSPVRRLVNTTIHFARAPRPGDLLRSPWEFSAGSDRWHWAWLERSFGGWYPQPGQFARCAAGRFRLLRSVDGTHDYYLTSEHWLHRIRKALASSEVLRVLGRTVRLWTHSLRQFCDMVMCMLITESWNWQFRGPNPPTRLLRQTWEYDA